ncbi:MAG: hypothetical protein SFU85_06310 [Candidatus Methylacidiphilales bacterium]|nr:hypothetical protein [Candidatus Methylacidiphilales bacterium]
MPVFMASTRVGGTIDEVYTFHTDPHNLTRLQPPGFCLSRLEMSGPPVVGSEARLTVRFLGVPQHWHVRLERLDPPHGGKPRARVVDRALASPFGFWRHQHVFEQEGGGVRLTDVVDFDPPGGRAGWVLLPGCFLVFWLLFSFRHAVSRRIWGPG